MYVSKDFERVEWRTPDGVRREGFVLIKQLSDVERRSKAVVLVPQQGSTIAFTCGSEKEEALWIHGLRALILHVCRKGGSPALRYRLRRRMEGDRYLILAFGV